MKCKSKAKKAAERYAWIHDGFVDASVSGTCGSNLLPTALGCRRQRKDSLADKLFSTSGNDGVTYFQRVQPARKCVAER